MSALIPDPEFADRYLAGSTLLANTHGPEKCVGEACVIHNPSDHHMRDWPLNWRNDRRLMERICPHGVGHPDPDSADWHVSQGRDYMEVHGCDGCCFAMFAGEQG